MGVCLLGLSEPKQEEASPLSQAKGVPATCKGEFGSQPTMGDVTVKTLEGYSIGQVRRCRHVAHIQLGRLDGVSKIQSYSKGLSVMLRRSHELA